MAGAIPACRCDTAAVADGVAVSQRQALNAAF